MGHTIQQHCCTSDTFWIYLVAILGLPMFSGLMSGLTLGLMSLGLVDLEVMKESGTPKDRIHAAKIIPVVRRHHLLLVTLLVGNAVAMEALPLFLDSLVDTWMAILLSVTLLLMFGEILPQAICSRYGLAVGATMAPVVRIMLVVMFPIAWPVSKLLDKVLGTKHNDLFRRAELITLVHMHGNEAGKGGELSRHETNLIAGTLELAGKTAADAMTPLASVVSIDLRTRIDDDLMKSIVASGHSRIPIYSGRRNNIIGLILAKNFLNVTVDRLSKRPTINVPIRKIQRVSEGMPLHDVLHEFCQRRSHMAVVVRSTNSSREKELNELAAEDSRTSAQFTEPRCASGTVTEEEAESEEAKALRNRERSSNGSNPPVPWLCGNMPRALSTGEEGDEIVGVITREDVLEELLKESLHLAKTETIVTIVDSQDSTKVSTEESLNDKTSLAVLLRQSSAQGLELAPQSQSMDEVKCPSVYHLRHLNTPASAVGRLTDTSGMNSSNFFWGSPNMLHISLSFLPTARLSAPSPPVGPEQNDKKKATPRNNEDTLL